jgi:hypothetical protein
MRLRFSIRDLLWLTLVVALAVGWWLDRRLTVDLKDRLTTLQQVLSVHRIEAVPINPVKSGQRPLNDASIEKAMRIDAIQFQGNVLNFRGEPQVIDDQIEFTPAK